MHLKVHNNQSINQTSPQLMLHTKYQVDSWARQMQEPTMHADAQLVVSNSIEEYQFLFGTMHLSDRC